MKARDHRNQSLKLLEIRLMLPPSSFRCEMRARTCTHAHTHTHTERTSRLAFAVTRFQRPLVSNGQERRKRHQNCTTTTNPFRLLVLIAFGLKSAISLSSSGHKLEQNFLWVSASRLSPACNEQVACPDSRRSRPRSGLRIFGVPCHTPQPTLERARPPLQAKPALSALLA